MFNSVNTCWTLVGAFLVYFMQAGFALCEAGFTRAKNTGNILMKNMMDFCIGTPCYWLIGFGLMFGGTGALIGGFDPFIQGDYSHLGLDIPLWVYIVFQTVFCATAATIVSGSMAERTNFKAYCVYSAAASALENGVVALYQYSPHSSQRMAKQKYWGVEQSSRWLSNSSVMLPLLLLMFYGTVIPDKTGARIWSAGYYSRDFRKSIHWII